MVNRVVVCGLLAFSLAPLIGCGSNSGDTTVTGKITYKGNPVRTGVINFLAPGGRPLGGGIGTDGGYSFELPPGEYQVRIDTTPSMPEGWKEGDPPPKIQRQVPEKFANFSNSGLTLTVTGKESQQTADFKLP